MFTSRSLKRLSRTGNPHSLFARKAMYNGPRLSTTLWLLPFMLFALTASADRSLELRKQITANGGIAIIGNAQMTCQGAGPLDTAHAATGGDSCAVTQASNTANSQNYNFEDMDWVNVDGGVTNSSIASLNLPSTATVRAAYLYWGAWSDGTITTAGSTNRGQVRFKVPGSSYQTITATTTDTSLVARASQPCDTDITASPADAATAISPRLSPRLSGGAADKGFTFYQSVADVTSLIPSTIDGNYSVADIVGLRAADADASAPIDLTGTTDDDGDSNGTFKKGNGNCLAGWTLVVMYEDSASSDFRSLNLYDGLVGVANNKPAASTTVSGFVTPAGSFNGQVGLVAYDGDGSSTNDSFSIEGTKLTNSSNPTTNFFNSTNSREELNSPFTVTVIDGTVDGDATAAKANGADFINPANANMLGFDIDTAVENQTVFGNAQSSLDLSFSTVGEFYLAGLFFLDIPTDVANLSIAKSVTPSTVALGETLTFTITVSNSGPASATGVVMRDPKDANDTLTTLDNPHEVFPSGLLLSSVTTSQGTCTIKDSTGTTLHAASASHSGLSSNNENAMLDCSLGTIAANGSVTITVKGTVQTAFLQGNKSRAYTNEATADANEGDTVEAADIAQASITGEDVLLAGRVWNDDDHDRILDDNETLRSGWIVNLRDTATGEILATKTTDSDGRYSFTTADISPGTYNVEFLSAQGSTLSRAVSNEFNGSKPGDDTSNPGSIQSITLTDGDNIIEQNLPLDPSGIVYNSLTGNPVAGATVTISGPTGFDPSIHLSTGQQGQVTGTDGYYRFDINQAAGAPAGVYTITVTPPAAYTFVSTIITPSGTLDVPSSAIIDPFLVVSGSSPDINGVTTYYLSFLFDGNDTNVVNNHIPLDPISTANTPILISKTTPKETVVKGDLVPYTIVASNVDTTTYTSTSIVDTIPPGFKYVTGTATLDGTVTEPTYSGRTLTWSPIDFALNESHTIEMTLVVGSGVDLGKYTNYVQVDDSGGTRISNIASATVLLVDDPIMDCSDIIGTVFEDSNANAYQDLGERGIPGVRVVTVNGLLITTDRYGRYHVACADIPQQDRGSNFILKVDERTLPTGYRLTSENPRVVRTTRGKLVKANFAASIMKVVRVQLDSRAFKADSAELEDRWVQQGLPQVITKLLEQGQLGLLRLVYWSDSEDADLVDERVDWVIDRIEELWGAEDDRPPLTVERELRSKNANGEAAQ